MFDEFRQIAKKTAKAKKLTYQHIATTTGFDLSTIRQFMCGVTDSRRVAEKIADTLGLKLLYGNGIYTVLSVEKEDNT